MALDKGQEAFKQFVAGVLGKITDPAQRQAAEAALNSVQSIEPVARALYDGVAGQSAISQQMADLAAQREALETQRAEIDQRDQQLGKWHTDLTAWYGEHQAAIAAGKAARSGRQPTPAPAPAPAALPENLLTKDDAQEALAAQNAAFLGFQRDQNKIMVDHFAKFKEVLNLEPLLLHPEVGTLGLLKVYELVHKDRLTQWDTDAKTAAEDKIRADERAKVLAGQAQMPYPSPTGAGSGSPLDALAVGKPDSLVDAAAAHYARLQAERAGGTAAR